MRRANGKGVARKQGETAASIARRWLQRARKDAYAARRLYRTDPALAVYLLHQAVEKTCKARLIGAGHDDRTIRKYSHKTLLAYIQFARALSVHQWIGPTVAALNQELYPKADSLADALDKVDSAGSTPAFQRGVAALSPSGVGAFLKVLDVFEKSYMEMTKRHLPASLGVRIPPTHDAKSLSEAVLQSGMTAVPGLAGQYPPDAVRLLLDAVVGMLTEDDVRSMSKGAVGTVKRREVRGHFRGVWGFLSLYLLAVIVLPHEASSRYPHPRSAPKDGREAAGQGQMGTEHYTYSLGVVAHLARLIQATLKTISVVEEDLASPVELFHSDNQKKP